MMNLREDLKLQPLRIPNGWVVTKNEFYELDPSMEPNGPAYDRKVAVDYLEDEMFVALYLQTGALIELGWIPAYDESGRYRIRLVWPDDPSSTQELPLGNRSYDWLNATVCFESSSRKEIIKRLEGLFVEIKSVDYDR